MTKSGVNISWDDLWGIYRSTTDDGRKQIREQLDLHNLLVGLSFKNRKMVLLEAPKYIQDIMNKYLYTKMNEVNNAK
jgi:hypothetical protein